MRLPESQKDEDYPPIPEIIKTISYLATFVTAVFTARLFLPIELQLVLAIIFVGTTILFVLWIWRRAVSRYWRTSKRNEIAGTRYPQLVRFCERLRDFAAPGTNGNPNYHLREIKSKVEEFAAIPIPESVYPSMMVWDLEKAIKAHSHNIRWFIWGTDALSSAVEFFNDAYLLNPSKEMRATLKKIQTSGDVIPDDWPEIPEHLLDGYKTTKDAFVLFVREFSEFVSAVNKQLGKDTLKAGDTTFTTDLLRVVQFDPPKDLETRTYDSEM
jgi:hypothetical protein